MKKVVLSLVLLFTLICFTGCEKVENIVYKEGTYQAFAVDTYNNEENMASATVVINANGKIESVYLDTTYNGSTKKSLADDYNMKRYNPNAAGEWYEQVAKLEEAVVENQGVAFLKLNEEGYTDAVSGCTIKVDALVKALSDALEQAK